MIYYCKNCGKEFKGKPSKKRKYCSPKCTHSSREWKERQRQARLGKPGPWLNKKRPKKTKEKISQTLKGNIPWNKGKHTGNFGNGFKKGNAGYWLGKKRDKETIDKMVKSRVGWKPTRKHRKKISLGLKKSYANGRVAWSKGLTKENDKRLERQSKALLALWKEPNFVNNFLKKRNKRPTKPERVFDEMTPGEVAYVGDFTFWKTFLNGKNKNPDFKIKGQNKVIEIFGGKDFYHTEKEAIELVGLYKQINYDCLIFWENEIYNQPDKVLEKTIDFISS